MALNVCFSKYPIKKNVFTSMLYSIQTKKQVRNVSSSVSNIKSKPGKVVFISQSMDVYHNLAFEDWLYQNWNFEKRHALFLWRNSPAVVIGRHQNPYTEANIPYLESAGVPVVRRNSGGGTVYHDYGNLNCTFFTPRENYDRKWNLQLICDALKKDFNIDSEINKKDDIVIEDGLKVSGTAAKLGRTTAYHHCTLLVNSDNVQLNLALQGDKTIKSKATESIPSSTGNLQSICHNLTVEKLLGSIGRCYLETSSLYGNNCNSSDGFTLIKPNEDWFPGLDTLMEKLKSWEWFYGMTPSFKVCRPISIEDSFSEGSSVLISLEVYHGIVKEMRVKSRLSQPLKELIEHDIGEKIKGSRYSTDIFTDIENKLLLERHKRPRYNSL